MTTILDQIIAEKVKEVARLKQQTIQPEIYPKIPTFESSIRKQETLGIIAEIKRASPSKGMIHESVDPVAQAKMYEALGANAISVLTDTPFFKGSMADLRAIRQAVQIPILCKDFIIDRVQIDVAHAAGANIILLIAAALDDTQLKDLYQYAVSKGLEVLCEVHNEVELQRILPLDPTLIGVNNRNLKTFDVDLTTTQRLAAQAKRENCLFISESGIASTDDAQFVAQHGAQAILVGETLMRSKTLAKTFQKLQIPLLKGAQVQ